MLSEVGWINEDVVAVGKAAENGKAGVVFYPKGDLIDGDIVQTDESESGRDNSPGRLGQGLTSAAAKTRYFQP